jgi:NAD(P)H-flavin reductase
MALKITNKEAGELCEDSEAREITSEEMEQVKIKDIDKDGKQGIISKDHVKELIGRSPDEWDSIMMRYFFELKKTYTTRISV